MTYNRNDYHEYILSFRPESLNTLFRSHGANEKQTNNDMNEL